MTAIAWCPDVNEAPQYILDSFAIALVRLSQMAASEDSLLGGNVNTSAQHRPIRRGFIDGGPTVIKRAAVVVVMGALVLVGCSKGSDDSKAGDESKSTTTVAVDPEKAASIEGAETTIPTPETTETSAPPATVAELPPQPELTTISATSESLGHGVWKVSWSPDGDQVAVVSEGSAAILDVTDDGLKTSKTFDGFNGGNAAAWSPSGDVVALGTGSGTVSIWNVDGDADPVIAAESLGKAWDLAWSSDGTKLAIGASNGSVTVWDASTQAVLWTKKVGTEVNGVAWSPDDSIVASGDDAATTVLWDAANGDELAKLTGPGIRVWSVAFSPDGSEVAAAGEDGSLWVWNVESKAVRDTFKLDDGLRAVDWSPDGSSIVVGSMSQTVQLLEAASGSVIATSDAFIDYINDVEWSPDGSTISAGVGDGTVRVWTKGS